MNLAIFGGSFDPPHVGHDCAIKAALNSLDIDKLVVLPSFVSPFKEGYFAPPTLRLRWAKMLWGEIEKVEISDFEISKNRPVPSIESVLHFKNGYEKIYFIIGADHLASLCKWHEIEKLFKTVEFVVASRDNIVVPNNFIKLDVNVGVSSSQIRKSDFLEFVPKPVRDEVAKFIKENEWKKE